MNPKAYTRLLILVLVASISCMLFAYSRSTSTVKEQDCPDNDKCCEQQKAHTDFIFWESLSRNLLSANR
ncbi:MAG: hypothetical protein P4L51_21875 [Puia sp.]|nr:hypothetical protein [Puia sp.]